jgi:hypothetical protein
METRDLPEDEWTSFFDHFSRLHHDEPVRMQIMSRPLGTQPAAHNVVLRGIAQDHTAVPGDAQPVVRIMAGDPAGEHVSYVIAEPAHVRVAEWNDGYSAALEIVSAGGSSVLVEVGPPREMLAPGIITDGVILDDRHSSPTYRL